LARKWVERSQPDAHHGSIGVAELSRQCFVSIVRCSRWAVWCRAREVHYDRLHVHQM
jgi:hypothetical protein